MQMPEVSEPLAAKQVRIRNAVKADLPAILQIYNYYVANSTATFDTELQTKEHRNDWWHDHARNGLPILVAEQDGEVIGWGSWSFYHSRCAYRQTVEPSLYIAREHLGERLGRKLMEALMDAARDRGYHCAVVLVCAENQASLRLLAEFNFEVVGTLKEVGVKFDRWLDVTIVQKIL